jgi:hypothetical protein
VQKLADKQAITPQVLLQALRRGKVQMFEGMFAQLTRLRHNLMRRIVFEPGGEGLSIACKAIGMLKPDFGSLFLLSLSARSGNKVVGLWKLYPNYLFGLKQVEDGGDRKAAAAE